MRAVRAPGRVNLIGEHTDYSGGFALPLAVDLELRLSFAARDDGRVCLRSDQAPDEPLDLPAAGQPPAWGRYVEGVRALLGLLHGIDGTVASNIPLGSGLSSSAALELAVARALVETNGVDWQPEAMARLAQRAEIDYAGNRCGIMDQLAVALGRAGHALLVDCRSLAVTLVRLPEDLAVVVCDSGMPRRLVDSAYNERRAACDAAARRLGIASLREATPDMVGRLPEALARRARHVVSENQRVLAFVEALRAGDAARMGELMVASHASLRDDYEVSSPELDRLVELALSLPGCAGSRLTGAGFGGCTVSLVAAGDAAVFAVRLAERYRADVGLPGRAWVCRAVDGVSLVP